MNIYKKSDIPEHLQKYFEPAEIGLEHTPDEYVANMVEVFRCVRDILADDGTLRLNLGDSYTAGAVGRNDADRRNQPNVFAKGEYRQSQDGANGRGGKSRPVPPGLKPKDLIGIPWRVAFALQADGWYLRSDIIWHKPNPMPESVTDRPTKSHEYIFLLSKSPKYYYDHEAVKEPGTARPKFDGNKGRAITDPSRKDHGRFNPEPAETRNRRSVWTVTPRPYKGAHYATFPPALIEPCILAGSRPGDVVLDPFMGSGTTAMVAVQHGRRYLGIELNPAYKELQDERIAKGK